MKLQKVILIGVAVLLFLTGCNGVAIPPPSQDSLKKDNEQTKNKNPNNDVNVVDDGPFEKNGLVPRAFDLRKRGGVTPIKNQYKDGACRSFASLAALESHIKYKHKEELDLSENNMEMRHGFFFNNKTREGRTRESDLPYLINGLGPILEEYDKYIPMTDNKGTSNKPDGYLTRTQVDNLTKVQDKPRARLVMGFKFLKKVDINNLTQEEDEKLIQIKQAIKEHGAVVSNIYMSHNGHGKFPYQNTTYYNSEKYAYYSDEKKCPSGTCPSVANHAIAIVGWDDNFKKENFTKQPPIDGAWICKDAQTESFGDKGYFYVSFCSDSIGEDAYVFTDVRASNEYDGIYQHDEVAFSGFCKGDELSGDDDEIRKSILFNRYEVKNDGEVLKEIGFYTTKPNAEYEVYLIPDFDNFKKEIRNKHLSDGDEFYNFLQGKNYKLFSGKEQYAGYHTKKLKESGHSLTKNKAFALGIWTRNPSSEDSEHKWDIVLEKQQTGGIGDKAKVGSNETFAFTDMGQLTDVKATGNACIKGYVKK